MHERVRVLRIRPCNVERIVGGGIIYEHDEFIGKVPEALKKLLESSRRVSRRAVTCCNIDRELHPSSWLPFGRISSIPTRTPASMPRATDLENILRYYNALLAKHRDDARAVGWRSA